MTSSSSSAPTSPVDLGGDVTFGEQQGEHGGALLALRAEEAQVASRRLAGARGAVPPRRAAATSSRTASASAPDSHLGEAQVVALWTDARDRPADVARRRAASAARKPSSPGSNVVELGDQRELEAPAVRRQAAA